MSVKTHRITRGDESEAKTCEFCNRQHPSYWSQVEDGDKAKSRCVWHCQKHRQQGRAKALSLTRFYKVGRLLRLAKMKIDGKI